ncbi:unnamed protein product [Brassica oleracea var. botrytis]|uniref:Knottin scorpion toxin-like domain-containing protein n=3 Tax=Brassica TaxID=3705 RepID=A0A0D3DI89_BRAOL|nr:unnamed protein product [Brassica napus]CDY63925.1 BnaC07g51310D [Brassica napus]VDD41133.1 unnamed protein product [Brassica oleracea]
MNKIRSLLFVSTITVFMLLAITAEQSAADADLSCFGPCPADCKQFCLSKGYGDGLCEDFRGKQDCCCTPAKKQIFEKTTQLNN